MEEDAATKVVKAEKEAATTKDEMSARVAKAEEGAKAKYRAKFEALKAELTEDFRKKDLEMWNKTSHFNREMKKSQEERDTTQASLQTATEAMDTLTSQNELLQAELLKEK